MAVSEAYVVPDAAGTPVVGQSQPQMTWSGLMELVSSVHQSRTRAAALERAALSSLRQLSRACGTDAGGTVLAKHESCWASHSSLLKSWDEAVIAEVKALDAVLQQRQDSNGSAEALCAHISNEVPCKAKMPKLEAEDSGDNAGGQNMAKSVPSPKKPGPGSENALADAESTSGTWAARLKASLSPDQIGGVGHTHCCRDSAVRKTLVPNRGKIVAKPMVTKVSAVLQPGPLPAVAKQGAPTQLVPNRGKIAGKPTVKKVSAVLQPSPLPAFVRQGVPTQVPNRGKIAAKPMLTKESTGASQATEEQRAQQRSICGRWPKPRTGEIELIIDEPWSFAPVQQLRSEPLAVQNFKFNILAFPKGTQKKAGQCLGAFVEAVPGDVEPDCVFKKVQFDITVVNWSDFHKSKSKSDTFTFKAAGYEIDRGWHDLLTMRDLEQGSCWVGPAGSVCIRARCIVAKKACWS